MPAGFYLAVTIFLGLCLGSFATALSWRLPRGVSVGAQRSKCPSCGRALGAADLVPVFSWLLLRGRCRTCKAPIGWRYPAIELGTLALCLAFFCRFGFSPPILALYALAPVALAIAVIDLDYKIIPNGLNIALLLLGAAALLVNAVAAADPVRFSETALTKAFGGLLLYGLASLALRQGVMAVLKREPLGLGDVKFFAASGFWLGPGLEDFAHYLILSGVTGTCLALVWKKLHGEAEFPFGPALLAALLGMLLWAPPPYIIQPV
jgi:leader peptidase (prepilin peptidase)/N-methyltransferase